MNTAKKLPQTATRQAKVIDMDTRNVYQQNGYKNRNEYLNSLADQYGTDMYCVSSIADMLGEGEDFDGLVSSLEDFSFML